MSERKEKDKKKAFSLSAVSWRVCGSSAKRERGFHRRPCPSTIVGMERLAKPAHLLINTSRWQYNGLNSMKKLLIRLLAAAFFGFIIIQGFRGCRESPPRASNVLFICVDDLRPDLGCYGNELIISPHLDALAADGVVFSNHFAAVPTCGASRCCLLTGMLPRTETALSNEAIRRSISGKPETNRPESFIHHLRRNGYHTVGIGKISHYADGLLYGYEDPPGKERELPHSWDELAFDAGKWETGWNAFFAYADGTNRQSRKKQVKPYECADVHDTGYPDGLTAELAVKKLRELKVQEKSFFLGVGFFKPHLPFNAPKKYWDLYEESNIPLSPSNFLPENINTASLHGSEEFNQYALGEEKASLDKPVSDAYARKLRHAYFACISYIDAQIGKILEELKRLDLDKNTIVVVWGDHGWHLGDHLVWGKHTLFEQALRSVLIIKAPGWSDRGKKRDQIVSTADIYPTLMELCGIPMPFQTDGRSLAGLLQKSGDPHWRNSAFSYYRKGISLRTDRFRLTRYFRPQEPTVELYDHLKDPHESHNSAAEFPDVAGKLALQLKKGDTGIFF